MSTTTTATDSSSSGGGQGKGKRKSQYRAGAAGGKKSKFASIDITKGLRGYLITCDQGKEQPCQREVIAWLTEYADRLHPAKGEEEEERKEDEEGDEERVSVGSALAAELKELKQQHQQPRTSKERFVAVDTGIRGIVFIQSRSPSVDHVALLYSMLTDVLSTRHLQTRYTIRIHPLLTTCFSRLTDLSSILPPILSTHLPPLPPSSPRTFAVVVNKRGHHSGMGRSEVIEEVVKGVGAGWRVDLDRPEVVVLVEVVTRMVGVGVVDRWNDLHKFNVRAMAEEGLVEGGGGKKGKENGKGERSEENSATVKAGEEDTSTSKDATHAARSLLKEEGDAEDGGG